jgi:uncharacterized protein with HEPN domain
MSDICDRLMFIFERMRIIEDIISKKNITQVLEDEKLLRPAILMHLMQIGESLNSLYQKNKVLIEKFDLVNEVKGAYNVRNFIAHDYEGVNLAIVEMILRKNLPELKEKLKGIKNEYCK